MAAGDERGEVTAAAGRLAVAERERRPCAPVRDLLGDRDVALAYAVQRRLRDQRVARGAQVVGHKIGLTSAAVQRQVGVDRPDFGVLFADMDVSGEQPIPVRRLLQPRIEAEIAFVLGADLVGDHLGRAEVAGAVAHATAALEIVDSRVAGWDISIVDTIADNASSGLYVLGDRQVGLDRFVPRDVTMRMYAGDELVSEGAGAACLGDPVDALLWLARTAQELGDPLRAGMVVLSGALGPMVPVVPGMTVRTEISALGPVTATFSA